MKDAKRYVISKGYERLIYLCPPLIYSELGRVTAESLISNIGAAAAHKKLIVGGYEIIPGQSIV